MSYLPFIEMRCFRAFGLAMLIGLAFLSSLESPARADDGVGTAIITLNHPVMVGATLDPYRAYYIRARRKDGHAGAQFLWHEGWIVSTEDDLAPFGAHGAVIMKELPAGEWEVNTFRLETHGRWRWWPVREFSIPFTIRPGRATYIGSYQPVGHMYKNWLGLELVGGASFVVTDQSARDIPIAQAKKPGLGPVDIEVFDVRTLNNPLLIRGADAPVPDDAAFSHDGQE